MPNQFSILEWSDEQILEEGRALRVAYQLKRTLRYNTKRDLSVHNESVAEHVFALFYLCEYFLPLEDPRGELDYRAIHQMILYHDFGEIPHGDVPFFLKTAAHEAQERTDAVQVFASLPQSMRHVAQKSWEEYERRESPEALFVYALDKVEPVFEIFDPINEQTPIRLQQSYDSHLRKKVEATQDFPFMRRFVDVLSEDMLKRGVFKK